MTTLLTILRGLRSRSLLSVTSLAMMVLAVSGAVLGPMFQEASTESYLLTRLDEAPDPVTALSWEAVIGPTGDLHDLIGSAAAEAERAQPEVYAPPEVYVVTDLLLREPDDAEVLYLARDDLCSTLDVAGRCPEGPGEVAVNEDDLKGLTIGETVNAPRLGPLEIVGVYSTPQTTDDWLFPSLLANRPPGKLPYRLAPYLVTEDVVASLPARLWRVQVESRLDVPDRIDEQELDEIVGRTEVLRSETTFLDVGEMVGTAKGNALGSVLEDARGQREAARSALAPAVVSLVLVALAMILRLQIAASELRAPELALASLRGVGSRRAWLLGLAEPWLLVVLSLPVGIIGGYAATTALARAWLRDGVAVTVPTASLVGAVGVTAALLVIAGAAVGRGMGETLGARLTGVQRPRRSGRLVLTVELGVVLLAAVIPLSVLGADRDGLGPADLLLPVAAAVAAGLLASRAVRAVATWWTGRGAQRPLPVFVAARAVARRSQGTLVILPVCAAVAVSVFAVGTDSVASSWRDSVAATTSPGAEVLESPRLLDETMHLTRDLDPEGRFLMAAAKVAVPGAGELVAVDSARLGQASDWSHQWLPGQDGDDAAALIAPAAPIVRVVGREVGITTEAESAGGRVTLVFRSPDGARSVRLGPLPAGTATTRAEAEQCVAGCLLEGIVLEDAASPVVVGNLTGDDVEAAPDLAASGWTTEPSGDTGSGELARTVGDAVVVEPGRPLVAGAVAAPMPVLLGVSSELLDDDADTLDTGFTVLTLRVAGRAESLPLVGPAGLMLDLPTYLLQADPPPILVTSVVVAAEDTPPELLDRLTAAGLTELPGSADTRRVLDGTAYAQALRLYLVVAVALLLMALGGLLVSTAVQLPARRRDAASLRVVGVSRRSLVVASLGESVAVLGAAAVAGLGAGAAALAVLLPSLELGVVDDARTPRVLPDADLTRLVEVAAGVVVVLLLVALLTSVATVRRARASSLRETAG
jgi:putative ABC transport system permease protein